MVEDEDIVADIFIEPPDVNEDTDQDSGNEDEGAMVDNLGPRQLRAAAEIRLPNNGRIGEFDPLDETDPEIPNLNTGAQGIACGMFLTTPSEEWLRNRMQRKRDDLRWIENADLEVPPQSQFPEMSYAKYEGKTATEMFELFVDDDLIEYIVLETQRYALFLNCPDPRITSDEIRCFLSILFITGYNDLPSKRHFWDSKPDMKNEAVTQAMRRDRFLQICRFLHFTDNNQINTKDKCWKIRPLIEKMKNKCMEHFVPEESLSFDESMVKYFGKHGCKQFIKGKPIRFGYKMWCINTKSGYLVNFQMYQGKNLDSKSNYDALFGTCASPLVVMLEELPFEKQNLRYNFYTDNLFSNANLFSFLKFKGHYAVGTVRENRLPKSAPLTDKKMFAKHPRGTFQKVIEANDGIIYIRWADNSVVTMMSNKYGVGDVKNVRRYSQAEKKHIMVPQPQVVSQYNKYMGGTDAMDQNIATYRIGVRSKKWYWPVVTWILDVAMQNSWILYNKANKTNMPQLDFRREVVDVYLHRYRSISKGSGRPSSSVHRSSDSRISDDIRYDGKDHLVRSIGEDKTKKKRCAYRSCKSIVRTMCNKCNVGLCINCFMPFHTK